jgi:hypothetical protein
MKKTGDQSADYEVNQLSELCYIINEITYVITYIDSTDFQIKFDTTPDNERLLLCKTELKALQNKLLQFNENLKDPIQADIREFRNYYKYCIQNHARENDIINDYKNYPSQWPNSFIKYYALEREEYMEFDYSKIDLDSIFDNDNWIDDIEKYIPLPGFKELIDCLDTILNFQRIFELYHMVLEDKSFNLENNKRSNNKGFIGFQSNLSIDQIENLYFQLKGSYIDENTNKDHFLAIFINEPLPRGCKIEWLKSNALITYFIKKIFHSDNPFNVWVKAQSIFIKDKKPMRNLRQSENNPFPKGYEEIDKILKSIYTS